MLVCRNSSQCLQLLNAALFVSFAEWLIVQLVMICTYYINVMAIITVIPFQLLL